MAASFSKTAIVLKQQVNVLMEQTLETEPHTSCYESLLECQNLQNQISDLQVTAKRIRRQFQEIFEDGKTIPAGSGRLRKARITARNGRVRLLSQQLLRVVEILLEDSPRVVFIPNLDRSTNVTVLFWITNDDEGYCTRMRHIRSIQQEVLEDGIKLYFQVEAVYVLPLFVNYMFDKCIRYDVFKCSPTGLSELDGKQLDFIVEILNGRSQVSSADSAAVKRTRNDA